VEGAALKEMGFMGVLLRDGCGEAIMGIVTARQEPLDDDR
jgi:hypothetical protein